MAGFDSITGDEDIDEQLLSLACHSLLHDDSQLVHLVRQWLVLASRSDRILNLVVHSDDLIETSVLLFETREHADDAIELLLQRLHRAIADADESRDCLRWVEMIIAVCMRHAIEARSHNWLRRLFHMLLAFPDERLRYDPVVNTAFSITITALLDCGSGAEDVLEKLFSHGAFRGVSCSEYRGLINAVLTGLIYDETLIENTVRVIGFECLQKMRAMRDEITAAIAGPITNVTCTVCRDAPSTSATLVFPCGHVMHMSCLPADHTCPCPTWFASCTLLPHIPYTPPASTTRINIFHRANFPLKLGPPLMPHNGKDP